MVLTEKQYLGPNVFHLAHLFVLMIANSFMAFALTLLLGRTIWSLAINMTTIESWEVERHHAVLRRARVLGGYLDAPDGSKVKIEHQEFPWDVGIWANFCQGMGSKNPLAWFWPLAKSPSIESGLSFEHNEIDGKQPWNHYLNNALLTVTLQIQPNHGRPRIQTDYFGLYAGTWQQMMASPTRWILRHFVNDKQPTWPVSKTRMVIMSSAASLFMNDLRKA